MFCLGTNGEFFIMSQDEKLEVIRIVVDEVADLGPCRAPFDHVPKVALDEIKDVLERTHAQGIF